MLTNDVARGVPPRLTTEELVNLVPSTVKVKPLEPTMPTPTLAGWSDVIAGTGFCPVMLKLSAFETPPPGTGLVTAMLAAPAVSTSRSRIAAVTLPELT